MTKMCDCERMADGGPAGSQFDASRLQPTLDRYKGVEGSLITVLQAAQGLYGYLPAELLGHIASEMKIKPSKVMGVVTFYTQFRTKPVGKHMAMLCQGTACHVNGSAAIGEAVYEELGIGDGGTTEDGLVTVANVACLGCCSLSPVMMVDGETHGTLTPDKAKKILRGIRMGKAGSR